MVKFIKPVLFQDTFFFLYFSDTRAGNSIQRHKRPWKCGWLVDGVVVGIQNGDGLHAINRFDHRSLLAHSVLVQLVLQLVGRQDEQVA